MLNKEADNTIEHFKALKACFIKCYSVNAIHKPPNHLLVILLYKGRFLQPSLCCEFASYLLKMDRFAGKCYRNAGNDELIWNNYRGLACWPAEGQNLRTHHSADGFVLASAKSTVVCCQFLDAQGLVGSAVPLYRFARHVSKPATLMSWLPTQMLQMCLVTYQHYYTQSSYQLRGFFYLVYVFVGVLVKVGAIFV